MKALISHGQVLCTYWVAAVLFGAVSPVGAITLDFESFTGFPADSRDPVPESARLSDQFRSTHGVIFGSGSPYVAVVNVGADRAGSGVNAIASTKPDGTLNYGVVHRTFAAFVDPNNPTAKAVTDFVSIRVIPLSTNCFAYFIVASATGYFIDYRFVSGGSDLPVEFSMPGIRSITVSSGNVAFDDLTFNPVKPIGVLYESAKLGTVGQRDGLELEFGERLGVLFHLNKAVHVTAVSAHFGAGEGATPAARIFRLSNAAGLSSAKDSEMMAHSLGVIAPGPSQEHFFQFYYSILPAGHYAFIIEPTNGPTFGRGDYSGRPVFFPGVDPEIRGTSYVMGLYSDWARFDSHGRGLGFRFVLYGVPLD